MSIRFKKMRNVHRKDGVPTYAAVGMIVGEYDYALHNQRSLDALDYDAFCSLYAPSSKVERLMWRFALHPEELMKALQGRPYTQSNFRRHFMK